MYSVELTVLWKDPGDVTFGKIQKSSELAVEAKSRDNCVEEFEPSKVIFELDF